MLKMAVTIMDTEHHSYASIDIEERYLKLSTDDFVKRFTWPATAAALNELKERRFTGKKSE